MNPPFYVFGDIHGQLDDLKFMLNKIGAPPRQRYTVSYPSSTVSLVYRRLLFLGDYVDRGQHSIPTIILLISLKVYGSCEFSRSDWFIQLRYPDQIYLLRGNHETRLVNRRYGFFDECIAKYGVDQGIR